MEREVKTSPRRGRAPDFSDPDKGATIAPLVAFLDSYRCRPEVATGKASRIAEVLVSPGGRALDIGCATGEDVVALGHHAGLAVGADISVEFLHEARRRHGSQLPLVGGTIAELPFRSGSFDVLSCERVLQHVARLDVAARELARVLSRDGRVICHEIDHGSLSLPGNPATVSKLVQFQCELHTNGRIGRELPELMERAGLSVSEHRRTTSSTTDYSEATPIFPFRTIVAGARSAGLITAEEAAHWVGELVESIREDSFHLSLTEHTVLAFKP